MPNRGKKFNAEILSKPEIDDLLKSFPPTATGTRNRALIAVYLYSQLRCNEGLDIRPADIAWDTGAITVLSGKGGKRRIAGIPREALDKYVRPWEIIRPSATYFFCSHKGNRIHDSYVRRMLKRIANKAGISHRVHTHCLRHSGACRLAEAGIEIRYIQRQLGHTSLATTERYISHFSPSEVITAVNSVAI